MTRTRRLLLTALLAPVLQLAPLHAATISGGVVTEDFTTLDYADTFTLPSAATATGVWDVANGRARAHAFANGAVTAARPIDFGNGLRGTLSSSTGYTFDTDLYPEGYNFQSVSITGGTITVTGSNPLIIRSLTTMTITPAINVNGADGGPGLATGAAIPAPTSVTCLARGGNGGSSTLAAGQNGGDSIMSDGTPEGNNLFGLGQTGGAFDPDVDGQGSVTGPASNDFETASNFVCGSGGPGGGGYTDTATAFGSGGSGGAGGGIVKLVSVGAMSVGPVLARGGDGGNGVNVGGGVCSGNGSGGNGGVVWMQTLGALTTSTDPDVTAGTAGVTACSIGSGQSFFDGFTRGDSAGARPGWATAAGSFDTDVVPAGHTSVIQSKPYPLGVLNAGFSAPTITSGGGGTVLVEFAGSKDGVDFDSFVTDLTALSDHDYRFVMFRATFTNAGAAGPTPTLRLVSIPYQELGLTRLDFGLAAGCGRMQKVGRDSSNRVSESGASGNLGAANVAGFTMTMLWMLLFYAISKMRLYRRGKTRDFAGINPIES